MGDPALVVRAIEQGAIGLDLQFGVDPTDVPIPDLTNPDPLVAMKAIIEFDLWVFSNAPRRGLVEVYTLDRSPEWEDLVLAADRMNSGTFSFAPGDGLSVSEIGFASGEDLDLVPSDVMDEAPEESSIVYYVYSIDPFDILDSTGTITRRNEGWTDRFVVAVLAPTDRGWVLYWEEGFAG